MSEDKIEFAKDLVASNISKANKEESSSSNNDDVSMIKETNHTIRQIEKKTSGKSSSSHTANIHAGNFVCRTGCTPTRSQTQCRTVYGFGTRC